MFWRLVLTRSLALLVLALVAAPFLLPEAPLGNVVLFSAFLAVLSVVPIWFLNRRYAGALRRVAEAVAAIGRGELTARAYVGAPEVRETARALNFMAERLTERIDRLEEDRSRLRAVLDGMIEGVVALDAAERIVFANARAGRLLDFDPDRARDKLFREVVRQRAVQELVRGSAQAGEPRRGECTLSGPPPRCLALYAAPLLGESAAGMIVVVNDVSEVRRLERLRQEFVANVSHELKTPLSVIKANVETLIDGAANDPVRRDQFLEGIDEQSDRLHALIIDLLRLARIESGEAALELTEFELDEVVATCVERHRSRAESKGLRLTAVRGGDAAVTIRADEEAVETILDNLIDNAIKYTQTGSVEVRFGIHGGHAWIEVADTGVGIPEADLPRVFERFYRVDRARSRELGGTGLGLAIVKHLAQAMGGVASARSKVGEGSVFTVRLSAETSALSARGADGG